MAKNKLAAPFLKWVGGKRQLITEIKEHLPADFATRKYFEPFIGGGALFFHLQPKKAVIADANEELINTYLAVKNSTEKLIKDLKKHKNTAEYFYEIRALDRQDSFNKLSDVERASRVIYLNKTCFNGLYRVNSSGEFNSPFGSYKNPNIVNEPVLKAVSTYLAVDTIKILNADYEEVLKKADSKSFVYLDPPYHPISDSSNFTGYVQGGWDEKDQTRLRDVCDELHKRGAKFLLSNSNASLIHKLYSKYTISTVQATRSINSNGEKRGSIDELLIKNYGD